MEQGGHHHQSKSESGVVSTLSRQMMGKTFCFRIPSVALPLSHTSRNPRVPMRMPASRNPIGNTNAVLLASQRAVGLATGIKATRVRKC